MGQFGPTQLLMVILTLENPLVDKVHQETILFLKHFVQNEERQVFSRHSFHCFDETADLVTGN